MLWQSNARNALHLILAINALLGVAKFGGKSYTTSVTHAYLLRGYRRVEYMLVWKSVNILLKRSNDA